MKKKSLALFLALVMVFGLTACSSSDSGSGSSSTTPETSTSPSAEPSASDADEPETSEPVELSGETIKIGHIADLTGSEALTGQEAKRSLEFAVAQLNGINGHPVEVITRDAQGSASGAADAARMLVETDGVVAIFGPNQAGQKTSVSEYCADAGIPLIFYNGTPKYLFATNPWLIGAGGANPQMTVMADYAYNELGYRTVDIVTMDNVGFKTFTDDFTTAFEALGGQVLDAKYAPFPCDDWSPYLSTIDKSADAIMAWTTGSNAIALWQNWYQLGLADTLPITAIMQSAFTDDYIIEALASTYPEVAEAILGTYAPSMYVYNTGTPENEAFVAAWQEEFGEVPSNNLSGQIYQAYQLLKTAIESIDGNTEPEAVRDAILATEIDGPAGHMSFDDSGACTKDVYIVQAVQLDDGSYNYDIVKTYNDVSPSGLLEG
jgi:ABC-type branched-subunit amino acid transport system substrate-binding protein